jgi:CRISPR-associated protein Csm1
MLNEETIKVALAALLHDIGKFWQRAGRLGTHEEASAGFIDEFKHLFSYDWLDDLRDGVGNHHRDARKEIEKVVKVADRLSSEERLAEINIPQSDPDKTPLLPITAEIEFREGKPLDWHRWGYRLNELRLDEVCVFPVVDVKVSPEDYKNLWAKFEKEVKLLSPITDYYGLISLLALLRKYATFIPSATPWEKDEEYRTLPDISLYDHLKVACAIAVCLMRVCPDDLEGFYRRDRRAREKPVARLLRADFSGIQSFLYRITRAEAEAEFRSTAKRLRGRSFYLTLLADVAADWLARELWVTPANILFCGGGRFDLLIGIDEATRQKLEEQLIPRLQNWLIREFHGEMGIQIAKVDLTTKDFEDLKEAFDTLEDELLEKKHKKFQIALDKEEFLFDPKPLLDVCNYCGVTPAHLAEEVKEWRDNGCHHCRNQREIGHKLPGKKTEFLAYLYDETGDFPFLEGAVVVGFTDIFGIKVALLNEREKNEVLRKIKGHPKPLVLYRLNETDFICDHYPDNVAWGFKFIGNVAPISLQRIDPIKPGKEPIRPEEILDFDEVAFMSNGAQLLGVLKADVDYLGQVFALGVKTKSISRIATLSSSFDLFFAGWINRICEQLANTWHADQKHEHPLKNKVNGLFYIVYSGGDDLLILGPWDGIVDLAQEINNQFRKFTCENENITLSAGILFVKPHFPVQRFAQLAGKQLDRSKSIGESQDRPGLNRKDRITLFGETVRWQENNKGFDQLLDLSKKVVDRVREDKLPRSFIHFLLRLHAQYFFKEREQKLMWVPKFFYALARRVSKEVIADKQLNLEENISWLMQYIRILANYVSLKIRRE